MCRNKSICLRDDLNRTRGPGAGKWRCIKKGMERKKKKKGKERPAIILDLRLKTQRGEGEKEKKREDPYYFGQKGSYVTESGEGGGEPPGGKAQ